MRQMILDYLSSQVLEPKTRAAHVRVLSGLADLHGKNSVFTRARPRTRRW